MLKRVLSVSLLCSSTLWANESDAPNSLDLFFDAFHDANQVYSAAPGVEWNHKWTEKISTNLSTEMDGVTGATRYMGKFDGVSGATAGGGEPKPKNIIDAISGSTKVETRFSQNGSISWSDHGTNYNAGFYHSKENDYESYSPNVGASWDFFERNFTLGLSHSEFFDRFSPSAPFNQIDSGGDKRLSTSSLSLAQSISPTLLVSGNLGYTTSWGYLGHPYNPVTLADGHMIAENLPSQKSSSAISASALQAYFWGDLMGSLKLDYRYYSDSWGLIGHTAEASITQYLTESLTLRLRARYYHQGAVEFAHAFYTGEEMYRTADVRFYAFNSYLLGIKLSGLFPESWHGALPQRWEIKADQLYRDTKGNRNFYQLYSPNEWYNQTEIFGLIGYDF